MKAHHILPVLFLVGVFGVAVAGGQELAQVDERHSHQAQAGEIPNWAAPATWSPVRSAEALTTMGAVTSPLPFIGITPCRIVDTRTTTMPNFPAGYGPPALTGGVPRNFTLTGQCGIPSSAAAVSLNVTVTNTQGPGFILIYPQGATQPNVSTLNYVAGQTIANAAVVPLGTGGGVTVIAGVSGTDLILDTNGYYAPAGVGTDNTFLGLGAGNFTMTGDINTAIGVSALYHNASGSYNTAIGSFALYENASGSDNTAIGMDALFFNASGSSNTAIGQGALLNNASGSSNTAIGRGALLNNEPGGDNTGIGVMALAGNTSGGTNTAIGEGALEHNSAGNSNTAVGYAALVSSTGSNNIGIGIGAGSNQTTGSHDIYIGNGGVNGESNTIRIGDASFQDGGTIITGISGLTSIGGAPVYVTGGGRLGTNTSSSRRFKQDVRDVAGESDGLMMLRPVAFKYKPEIDPAGLTQYGLIAEEVAEVSPDLVTCDRAGQPEGVRYHLITPLLLNEVQKQRRTIESQQTEIEGLKARLSRLEARLLAESRP